MIPSSPSVKPPTSPALPRAPYQHELTSADCQKGAVLVPNSQTGSACHIMKTGVNIVAPDAANTCPIGYRLILSTANPYCSSDVAGDTKKPTHAAMLSESESCAPGHFPLIGYDGKLECRQSTLMDAHANFNPDTDCPVGTYVGVMNNLYGCIQR